MADYTKYNARTDDLPRRRRRRQAGKATHKRKHLWLKLTLLALFLLVIIGMGVAAGAIFALARNLPSLDSLQRRPDARNTIIYDRHGVRIGELYGGQNRVVVPDRQIPAVMKQATVAIEDERFYEHHGVDYKGLVRAVFQNLRAGGVVQGGSTITEQFVKNAYVGNERTYTRKLREAVLAWQLEDKWTKDRILSAYLNTVFYGSQAYGVEAAARTYFHVGVAKLSLRQAALLAAIPKAPSEFDPVSDPQQAKTRRDIVLQAMADQGYITQAKATHTMQQKLGVFKHAPAANNSLADYFISYVTKVLTKRYGSKQVFEGGLKVYTSIDMKWQQAAIDIVKSTTGPLNFGFKPSAALVAIDPANGYIRTMVGGLDYKKQRFNLASQAKRQPGSSMKPFVLANAVEQGMSPWATYYNSHSPIVITGYSALPWVVNGDGPGGMEDVASATTISDNVVYAQLSVDAGPQKTVDIAHRMGVTSTLQAVPSITLGTSEVTPLEMADAYATLAAGGIHHRPQAIVKVVLPSGRVDWKPKTDGVRAIPAGVSSVVTQCLEKVVRPPGTAYKAASYYPYPSAGKTGTTDDSADVWFDGYTPKLAASVWMGNMNARSPMSNAFGGDYCAPMWAKFMAIAMKGSDHSGFTRAPWSFSKWDGKFAGRSPSPSGSASPSKSASPKPSPSTKTIKPTVTPTHPPSHTPTPRPTKTKTPTPTATPSKTGTPTGSPKALHGVFVVDTQPVQSSTGTGGSGLVGHIGAWLSGLFGF
jgi:penicillin-binding protein 1A